MYIHIRKIARGWYVYSSPTAAMSNLTYLNCFSTRKAAQAFASRLGA